MPLKDTAHLLGVSWDTIKEIHTHHRECHYAPPSLAGVDSIGIDEFAVRKGHVYKTIVVDLKSGQILHVGEGKAADALAGFWKRVRRKKLDLKYIAPISLPLSSPPYLKTARTPCMSSTIFMWSN